MLLYYASVQSVSVELYEVATIDEAGAFKRMRHVTCLAMTDGGSNGAATSLLYQLYQYGFNSGGKGTGQAMALGVIIFLILIVFTIFYFWLNRKVEDRY